MSKLKNGKRKQENAVSSVAEIPLTLIQAMALINETIHDPQNGFDSITVPLGEAYAHLDGVMTFIAGGKCNLGETVLTDGQQEYLRYVLDQFAKGEEIAALNVAPIVVSVL